jgi:tubulin-folding cofactor B
MKIFDEFFESVLSKNDVNNSALSMAAFHVTITANEKLQSEIDVSGATPVSSLRQRLYAMTGFSLHTMKIKVNGVAVEDETQTLGELSGPNVVIEVTGKSEFGDLDDVSAVPKFELADDDYDRRTGTVRDLERRAGIPVRGEAPAREEPPPVGIDVGERCEVELADGSHHRGAVRYVGKRDGAKGYWVGAELDEPFGKNNGTLNGKKYFECDDNFGIFVRPAKVKVGDYPKIDWEAALKDEM